MAEITSDSPLGSILIRHSMATLTAIQRNRAWPTSSVRDAQPPSRQLMILAAGVLSFETAGQILAQSMLATTCPAKAADQSAQFVFPTFRAPLQRKRDSEAKARYGAARAMGKRPR